MVTWFSFNGPIINIGMTPIFYFQQFHDAIKNKVDRTISRYIRKQMIFPRERRGLIKDSLNKQIIHKQQIN